MRAVAKRAGLRSDEVTSIALYFEALQHSGLTLFLDGQRYYHTVCPRFYRHCMDKVKISISTIQNLSPWYVAPMLLLLAALLGGLELRATAWQAVYLVVIVNLPSLYRMLVWLEIRWLR